MFDRELTPEQRLRHRLVQNRAWLNRNFEAIQKEYADKWVAVLDERVTAHDPEVEKVRRAVADRVEEAVIMRVPSGAVPTPI
ncbi:MAG: DUF5678 domain-containing protein [Thermodesulfobacteriota bacterium]